MNLLLIDKIGLAVSAREMVFEEQYHFNVDHAYTVEDVREKYAADKYDVVIVDFSYEPGAEALTLIEGINPKQRVIVLSDSDAYSEPNGCAYCVEHSNRRRLKSPVSIMALANLVRDFDYTQCAHFHE